MVSRMPTHVKGYGVAILTTASALILTLCLQPWLTSVNFSLFYAAIAISAWYKGHGPGLVATALSTLAIAYFISPPANVFLITLNGIIRLGVFVLVALLISSLETQRRIARERAQTNLSQLRESEEQYRRLLDTANEGIWLIDAQLRIKYANQQMAQMLGLRIEDMLDHDIYYFMDIMARNQLEQQIERQKQGIKTQFDLCFHRRDGSNLWAIVSASPIMTKSGEFNGAIAMITDVTERKQAEEALQKDQQRLKLAQQIGKIGTFDWNIPTGELTLTGNIEAIYGLAPGGFTNYEDWADLIYADDRVRVEQEVKRVLQEDTELDADFRILQSDGSLSWIATKARLFRKDNKPVRMLGVEMDITERRRAEEERQELLKQLENSLRQLEAVVSSIREGLIISDPEGNVLTMNPAALRIHEHQNLAQVRRQLEDFQEIFELHYLDGRVMPLEEWPLARSLRGETFDNYEVQVHRLDTGKVWIGNYSGTPVHDSSGRMILAVTTLRDVTANKRAQEELAQSLEREQAARESAEVANRIKDEFLATLSHELRTPLNAMLGWTTMLRSRKFNETTTARALETIERNTKSLAQLIEDVLDVSGIIRGKLNLDVRQLELTPVIQAAIEVVRPAAEAKEIGINFCSESLIGIVSGDINRLQQVFWNLLSNAVKFTPQKGRVEVRLLLEKSRAQVRVTDTGVGISAEFLPYVFDRFRQADSARTRAYGGLGLGLAIVRHLVELHGGTVHAESLGIGKGATFIVELPLRAVRLRTPQNGANPLAFPDQIANPCPLSLEELRILVVDDQAEARELLSLILEQYGAQVKTVANASDALVTLQQLKPDVLVSDIGMPGEDGYALIKRVRALSPEQGGKIPAVALTAYARPEDCTAAILAGFHLHVSKPVDPHQLAVVVANLAGRHEPV
ncbi:PAS domain S-box protein [Lyngbya aestuarii]|uniref:PAS domain S-box protein n=1 Tax=Lyngbya aestuarii TaxID=118322 RepID=UPI00403DE021